MSSKKLSQKEVQAARLKLLNKYFPDGEITPFITCPVGRERLQDNPEDYLDMLEEIYSVIAAVAYCNYGDNGREPLSVITYRNTQDPEDFVVFFEFTIGGPTVTAEYRSATGRVKATSSWGSEELQGEAYIGEIEGYF